MCRLFPCIPIFRRFFFDKKCKNNVFVYGVKNCIFFVKNVCFGVKKGISENMTRGGPKTYYYPHLQLHSPHGLLSKYNS